MPPKKAALKKVEVIVSDTDSDCDSVAPTSVAPTPIAPKKALTMVKFNPTDSDRLQLAQAINNITIKADQLQTDIDLKSKQLQDEMDNKTKQLHVEMETKTKQLYADMELKQIQLTNILKADQLHSAMNTLLSLNAVKISELDMLIESKKLEYNDKTTLLESDYKTKQLQIETDFKNKQLQLDTDQKNKLLQLDTDLKNKKTQVETDLKNKEIQSKLAFDAYKQKACEDAATELGKMLVKKEDYERIQNDADEAKNDMQELKDSFDENLKSGIAREKAILVNQQKQEISILDLTHKAHTARLEAQCEQQKKEIEILNSTISNLKQEIAAQRDLTREVAQAGSKAQITQKIGSKD